MTTKPVFVASSSSTPITASFLNIVSDVIWDVLGEPSTVQDLKETLGIEGQLPTGGTTAQVLAKTSNVNYECTWVDQSGGGGGSNAYGIIVVDSTNILATIVSDTLTLSAGTNITLVPDALNKNVTINASTNTVIPDGDKGDITVTSGVWQLGSDVVTNFARTFLDDINAGAVRTTLGVPSTVHSHAGGDISSGTISANYLPVFGSTAAGIVPLSGGSSTDYLCADGTWNPPAGSGGGGTWGSITGTLSSQTDLQAALNAKSATTHSHSNATTSVAGYMSAADKTKLDGVESGASADQTGSEIVSLIDAQLGQTTWKGPTDGDKGDIVVSSTGSVWTIDTNAVTYAKMQQVSATDKLLGRSTAGAGNVEEITCTSFARSLLDDADASAARTTLGVGTGGTWGTIGGTLSAQTDLQTALTTKLSRTLDDGIPFGTMQTPSTSWKPVMSGVGIPQATAQTSGNFTLTAPDPITVTGCVTKPIRFTAHASGNTIVLSGLTSSTGVNPPLVIDGGDTVSFSLSTDDGTTWTISGDQNPYDYVTATAVIADLVMYYDVSTDTWRYSTIDDLPITGGGGGSSGNLRTIFWNRGASDCMVFKTMGATSGDNIYLTVGAT